MWVCEIDLVQTTDIQIWFARKQTVQFKSACPYLKTALTLISVIPSKFKLFVHFK